MAVRGITVSVCLCLIAAPALAAFSKNEIRELEDLLARLGFNPGPVDGVLDAQTRIAIRDYQKFAALPVAGWASQRLLDELRGVTESLGDVRIREAAAQAVAGSDAVKTQKAVPQPILAAPKPLGPKRPAPKTAPIETAAVQTEAPKVAAEMTSASARATTFEIALQFALFRTEGGARRGWAQLQQQLPDLLGDMNPRFPVVDLGDGGTYYRVVTGPFPNRATAADLCAMVRAEGQACLVIRSAPQQVPQHAEALTPRTAPRHVLEGARVDYPNNPQARF